MCLIAVNSNLGMKWCFMYLISTPHKQYNQPSWPCPISIFILVVKLPRIFRLFKFVWLEIFVNLYTDMFSNIFQNGATSGCFLDLFETFHNNAFPRHFMTEIWCFTASRNKSLIHLGLTWKWNGWGMKNKFNKEIVNQAFC